MQCTDNNEPYENKRIKDRNIKQKAGSNKIWNSSQIKVGFEERFKDGQRLSQPNFSSTASGPV